jgi:hypothetical protein
MFRFFRKIRYKLLDEGHLSKYTYYAIGEIMLVVIGILIALQINNWNEARKAKNTEIEILKLISIDLDTTIEEFERLLKFDQSIVDANKFVLEILNNPESTYDESMARQFGLTNRFGSFTPSRLTYESIRTTGFNIISNIEVRNSIFKLYDSSFNSQLDGTSEFLGRQFTETSMFINTLFSTGETVIDKIPNDFDLLKSNQAYVNLITLLYADSKSMLQLHKRMLEETRTVKKMIDNEVNQLESNN